jgi:hypothetical protein
MDEPTITGTTAAGRVWGLAALNQIEKVDLGKLIFCLLNVDK